MLSINEFFIYQNLTAEITIFDGYISKTYYTFPLLINQNIPYLNPCYRNDVRLFMITFGPRFGGLPIRLYRVWGLFSFTRWLVILKRVCQSRGGGGGGGMGLEIKWRGFFLTCWKNIQWRELIHHCWRPGTMARGSVVNPEQSVDFSSLSYPGAAVRPTPRDFVSATLVTNDTGDWWRWSV